MISQKFDIQIVKELGFEPTTDQVQASALLSAFITGDNVDRFRSPVMILRGYAGTGKTSLIGAFVRALARYQHKSVLLAPTGRAAKVFSFYAKKQASTIHKKIYRQKSGKEYNSSFVVDKNLHKQTVFIVDEASMIADRGTGDNIFGSGNVLSDLIQFVYSGEGCRLILIGDVAQLPPVGLSLSPALREQVLEGFGLQAMVYTLRQVVRQTKYSGILLNATRLRQQLVDKNYEIPKIVLDGFSDIERIPGNEFVELLQNLYSKQGRSNVAVVTRSNKQANTYNMGIRNQVLWHESELTPNDRLMVVKNNYFWAKDLQNTDFIANGDFVEVVSIRKYEEKFGYRFADVTLRPEDYDDVEIDVKIILNALSSEAPGLSDRENQQLFYAVEEKYSHIANRRNRFEAIKQDAYYNALQVKFAYAMTCHKTQGGQWKHVYLDPGYITEERLNREYLRWLYTAVTRATEKLFLVNFNEWFFGGVD